MALGPGSSSTTPVVDDAPVFDRLRKVVNYVSDQIPAGSKGSVIGKRIAGELLTDMTEIPPEFVEFYLKQLATMVYWTSTGKALDEIPLPPGFEAE